MNEYHLDPPFSITELLTLLSLKNLPQNGYRLERNVLNITLGYHHFGRATVYKTLKRLQHQGYVARLEGGLYSNSGIYDLTQKGELRLKNEIRLLRQLVSVYDYH